MKRATAQCYKEEKENNISAPVEQNSIITSASLSNTSKTEQSELITTINKPSLFKKSKPFWKVRSMKNNLSKAKNDLGCVILF